MLWRGDRLRVVEVTDPDYPGYTRVIWNAHAAEMTDLDEAARNELMHTVWTVERVQRDVLSPDKVNLASLGNMVPHLHWHIIPRWRADRHFPDAIWAAPRAADPPATPPPARGRLAEYRQRLIQALSALSTA